MEEQKIKKTRKATEKKEDKVSSLDKPSENSKNAAKTSSNSKNLICIIRIAGEVKVKPEIVETLYRLRLRKKYACTLINPSNAGLKGMVEKVKHSVAYGEIDRETLVELLKARAQKIGSTEIKKAVKEDYEEIADELISGKSLTELGFKGFFRLHPPRKGINSKIQYPKGALGNHKSDINKLVRRML
jgi:large subunit ribosomal protein L30